MSLINDALKRARQAHQENSAPAVRAPDLRPVEPPQQATQARPGLLVPAVLVVVALTGLLLCLILWKKQGPTATAESPGSITAAARTAIEPVKQTAAVAPVDRTGPAAGATAALNVASRLDNPPTSEPSATGPKLGNSAAATTNQAVNIADVPATNHPAAAEAPSVPPLKLQSIVFNPRSPSALINGRVVFVGDRVREFHVAAIRRAEVVLTGVQTNLTLNLDP